MGFAQKLSKRLEIILEIEKRGGNPHVNKGSKDKLLSRFCNQCLFLIFVRSLKKAFFPFLFSIINFPPPV